MSERFDIAVLSGVSKGDVFHFHLDPGGQMKIGRNSDCDLVLQEPAVSRQHAQIEWRPEGLFLTDLGSSGGTIHMGFQLRKGPEGGRRLSNEDEFKIGEAIFRIKFNEEAFARKPQPKTDKPDQSTTRSERMPLSRKKRLIRVGGIFASILLLLVLLAPGENKQVVDKSNMVLSMPQERIIGYIEAAGASRGDKSHRDKAQFSIPAANLVIEYEFRSQAPVDVLLDRATVETLQPNESFWQMRQMMVRDVMSGSGRKLIFDNQDYPRKSGETGAPKLWGVRNIRMSAISTVRPLDQQLAEILPLIDVAEASPKNIFRLIRSMQEAVLAQMTELHQDAGGFEVSVESAYPTTLELREQIGKIVDERALNADEPTRARHLNQLMSLTARLDGELWRRVNSRVNKAELAASTGNYIEAHDNLLSVKEMFPEEDDFRWLIANRMFTDKKIVPDKVRKKPEKFRKNK